MEEKQIIKEAILKYFPGLTETGTKFKTMKEMIEHVIEQIKSTKS